MKISNGKTPVISAEKLVVKFEDGKLFEASESGLRSMIDSFSNYRISPPDILKEAMKLKEEKGKEHGNNQLGGFEAYCPFGLASAATLLHREALRVCACVDRGTEEVWQHLKDLVVYAVLMSEMKELHK